MVFGSAGSWEVLDALGTGQLNLHADVGGTITLQPTITDDPPTAHLDNMGVCEADYVRISE